MQITANLLDRKAIIEELKTDNSSLRDTIDQMAKKWSRDRATIKNFKTIETRETDGLHKTILDMDVTISDLMDNDRRINGFLDEYRVTVDNRDKTIEELHTKIWELERTLPANFWDVVAGRDATIRKQRTTIEDYKETIHVERMDRVTEKESINRKFCEDLRKKNAIIEELKDGNIEDLKERYDLDKEDIDMLKHVISTRDLSIKSLTSICQSSGSERNKLTSIIDEKDKMIEKQGREISGLLCLRDMYDGLSAELSARKEDSAVLKEVVEIVKNWDDLSVVDRYSTSTITAIRRLYHVVKDYTDAPEGPPETPIDEKVCVFCGCKNPSIQVGRDWFCSMRCADGQADVNKHIHDTDETQDITVTFAFLELP